MTRPQFAPIAIFICMPYLSKSDVSKFSVRFRLILTLSKNGSTLISCYWIRRKLLVCFFPPRPTSPLLLITFSNGTPLQQVDEFKYLALSLNPQLSFMSHITSVVQKINFSLRVLYRSISCFTLQVRKRIISQLILRILDYADIVYQNTPETNLHPLNVIYHSLCRFILRCPFRTHHCAMYE